MELNQKNLMSRMVSDRELFLSPLLFSIYVNELIQKLRDSGMGCWVGGNFMGIFAYADDLIILAPRRDALQKMIRISESYMIKHKIFFSTKKTKCMYFANKNSDPKDIIEKVEVAGKRFPWVAHAVHIGNTLHEDGTMEQDVKVKRATFIEDVHNLQQEFHKCHPEVQAKLMTLYSSSCYGSNAWNLYGTWAKKLFTSWNVNLKYIWDLPHETHRHFFEHLTECRHLKILLIKRFLKFVLSISDGMNGICKMLLHSNCRNVRSVTGSNLRNIELETGERVVLGKLKKTIDKIVEKIEFERLPEAHIWKIGFMKETALVKSGHLVLDGFSVEEIDEILRFICTQ